MTPGADIRPTRGDRPVRSGFLPDRTIHLHPLARCNLACKHCYSWSGPEAKAMLPIETLGPALETLRAEGYEVLSLSGGEPMLYPELRELTALSRALGFRTVAITNGFRVNARFADLLDRFDGLAVSFDGMKEVHDRVRGNPRAFDMAVAALEYLQETGKPAAAAYTASRDSLGDIPDFVEMAARLGVRAVQIRPLVMAGRAAAAYSGPALTPADASRLWLIGQALAEAYRGRPAIHTDLAHSRAILADRAAWAPALEGGGTLSDLVNPLVVTPEGRLRPFTYDFPERYDLGRIEDLAAGAPKRRAASRLGGLVRAALADMEARDEFIDWFAHARDFARRGAG